MQFCLDKLDLSGLSATTNAAVVGSDVTLALLQGGLRTCWRHYVLIDSYVVSSISWLKAISKKRWGHFLNASAPQKPWLFFGSFFCHKEFLAFLSVLARSWVLSTSFPRPFGFILGRQFLFLQCFLCISPKALVEMNPSSTPMSKDFRKFTLHTPPKHSLHHPWQGQRTQSVQQSSQNSFCFRMLYTVKVNTEVKIEGNRFFLLWKLASVVDSRSLKPPVISWGFVPCAPENCIFCRKFIFVIFCRKVHACIGAEKWTFFCTNFLNTPQARDIPAQDKRKQTFEGGHGTSFSTTTPSSGRPPPNLAVPGPKKLILVLFFSCLIVQNAILSRKTSFSAVSYRHKNHIAKSQWPRWPQAGSQPFCCRNR